jgi:hypothetical protein
MPDDKVVNTSPIGRGFKKGHDARRNTGGVNNRALQSYTVLFKNALAEGLPPKEFAEIVIKSVRRNQPGAREFYADRVMGKVKDDVANGVNLETNAILARIADAMEAD